MQERLCDNLWERHGWACGIRCVCMSDAGFQHRKAGHALFEGGTAALQLLNCERGEYTSWHQQQLQGRLCTALCTHTCLSRPRGPLLAVSCFPCLTLFVYTHRALAHTHGCVPLLLPFQAALHASHTARTLTSFRTTLPLPVKLSARCFVTASLDG